MEDNENEGGGIGAAIAVAAIPAIVNMIGNWWQNRQNRKNQEWINQYNSPTEQMARYRSAGLNPNLIYGSGTTSAGNASSLPSYQRQPQSVQDILNAATAVLNLRTMKSQELKNNAEAQEAIERANGQALANYRASTENHYLDSYLEQRNHEQSARIAILKGNLSMQDYQKEVLNWQAAKLFEDMLYTKFKRDIYEPELLGIKRQELSNASAMLASQLASMYVDRRNETIRGGILAKDFNWYNWRAGVGIGKDVLSGIGSAIGAVGLGKIGSKAIRKGFPYYTGTLQESKTMFPDGTINTKYFGYR